MACDHTRDRTVARLDDALELAGMLRPSWPEISAGIPEWHPRNEEDDPDPDPDPRPTDADPDPDPDPTGRRGEDADPDDDPDPEPRPAVPDWKRESRKHERRAKQSAREAEDLRTQLKEYQDRDKSERDRAVEEALKRGRDEALAEADRERRADHLEMAVLRIAAKGVKVGSGDEARSLKFDDPEDALVFIERAIARRDLDAADVFDDSGRVKQDTIEEELADLLERKPRLAATDPVEELQREERRKKKDPGEIDAGKGKGDKGLEDMSPDDHFKAITSR